MKTLDWYFDFISPFAYLQSEKLDAFPDDVEIRCIPILFAGLLNHWEHKGPAEIPPKRVFTYQHVLWLSRGEGIPLHFPPGHPFNPLKALRLAVACGASQDAVQTIFRHIWRMGRLPEDGLQELGESLGLEDAEQAISAPEVKAQLKENTEKAALAGVFGVPTFVIENRLLWGNDATDMVLDYLRDPTLFQDPEMQRVSQLPRLISRI